MTRYAKVIGLLLVLGGAIYLGTRPQPVVKSVVLSKQTQSGLAKVVQESLAGTQGTYGVAIKNLKTDESFYANEHRVFESGSLYKLWVMGVVFNQIENGTVKEGEILSDNIAQLNTDFGVPLDVAELTDGGISLSVADALNQMITISHNYAAFLLTKKVKLASLQPFLIQNGFKESKVGVNGNSPTTTASDMSLFLEKLYKGELASSSSTIKMLALLKKQELNEALPKYLPSEIAVAHKTGDIDLFKNDAGIVYVPNGDYIIVVLSESPYPYGAEERIAQLSKAVYDYFAAQK